MSKSYWSGLLILPLLLLMLAFFLLPIARLVTIPLQESGSFELYRSVLTHPRYLASLFNTVLLSLTVSLLTLLLATVIGFFFQRNHFYGRDLLLGLLSIPLSFPGVVVGFMIIMLGGRRGVFGALSVLLGGERVVFAYSLVGLLLGYIYFSLPRVLLTMMGAIEKIDIAYEEAARSLGASNWRCCWDVLLPALMPSLLAAGAICFATSMGAFGTAFTLATELDILPMTIYSAFTLNGQLGVAAVLSLVLGLSTWLALLLARVVGGRLSNYGGGG